MYMQVLNTSTQLYSIHFNSEPFDFIKEHLFHVVILKFKANALGISKAKHIAIPM